MRTLLLLSILGLIIVSAGGYIAVSFDILPVGMTEFYNDHFSFVTGIASVIGLLAFASTNKIKSTDFESEEIEKFKSLMRTAEELEEIEHNRNQTEKDLQELERKKKVMEISVKKAGLVLFYREQNSKHTEIVSSKIESDKELKNAIEELIEASSKLSALQEEIESDENVDIIKEILEVSKRKSGDKHEDPVLLMLSKLAEKMASSLNVLFR